MAADNQPLLDFIEAAKSQGASDEFVVDLLRQNGWPERRIYQAFSLWYSARTGRAVPSGGGRMEAAKDAFFYLLAFITLGIWAVQLGALLFAAIDRGFPNPALDYPNTTYASQATADQLASILVGFPVFLAVSRRIARDLRSQPERLESPVRKWLTYIAMVIAASVVIGDIVTFLAYLLRGDLDRRFVLKVLAVLVIAGGILTYYLDSLHPDRASPLRNRWFAIAALAVAGFGIVVGFVELGSPVVQRLKSEDARRLSDLSSLSGGLHARWLARGQSEFTLPQRIEDLQTLVGAGVRIVDPVNGRPYDYVPLQGTGYRICATFSQSSPSGVPGQWRHAAGPTCFSLDARENIAPVPRP
jgi:hypothetical protein